MKLSDLSVEARALVGAYVELQRELEYAEGLSFNQAHTRMNAIESELEAVAPALMAKTTIKVFGEPKTSTWTFFDVLDEARGD